MVRIFPIIFVLLWSSAFITTKPLIDNSDPFSALAFRFSIVTLGFFLFSLYSRQKILVNKKNFIEFNLKEISTIFKSTNSRYLQKTIDRITKAVNKCNESR